MTPVQAFTFHQADPTGGLICKVGLMAQLIPTLRVAGEAPTYVTPPQGFPCESYPPNLTVSFLGARDSLTYFRLSHQGPQRPALSGSSTNTHSMNWVAEIAIQRGTAICSTHTASPRPKSGLVTRSPNSHPFCHCPMAPAFYRPQGWGIPEGWKIQGKEKNDLR